MYDRINRTRPTAEMAIYYLNAVVNAALKFPLQVAAISVTVLREWNSKNRGIVKKAAFLPRNTCPELLHLPKEEGDKGITILGTRDRHPEDPDPNEAAGCPQRRGYNSEGS